MTERVARREAGGRVRIGRRCLDRIGCSARVRRWRRKHGGLFVEDDHRARIYGRLYTLLSVRNARERVLFA